MLAAQHDNTPMLHWAVQQACRLSAELPNLAAANGHVSVLTWLRERGCAMHESVALAAAEHGQAAFDWALSEQ